LEEARRFVTHNDGFIPIPFPSSTRRKDAKWNVVSAFLAVLLLAVLIALLVVNGRIVEMARFEDDWQEFYEKVILKTSLTAPSLDRRGIVYTASGADVTSLLTSIMILRSYGCTLPIQVFTFHGEINSTQRLAIESLDVDLLAIEDQTLPIPFPMEQEENPDAKRRKYFIKPAAILACKFDSILYLDSDNYVTTDPTFLFDMLKNYTAVFWPDYWVASPSQPMYKAMHLTYRREFEFESGQMVISKRKSQRALNLAMYLNMYNAISSSGVPTTGGDNVVYKYLHGDKDTFKFAWNATSTPYYFVPTYARPMGHGINSTFCGHTMAQAIPPVLVTPQLIRDRYHFKVDTVNYPPLFLHMNAAKYVGEAWDTFWPNLTEKGPWRTILQYKPEAQTAISSAQGWTSKYPGAFPFRTIWNGDLPVGTYCIGLGGSSKNVDFVDVVDVLPNMNAAWVASYFSSLEIQRNQLKLI
jgi:hypothetical protein